MESDTKWTLAQTHHDHLFLKQAHLYQICSRLGLKHQRSTSYDGPLLINVLLVRENFVVCTVVRSVETDMSVWPVDRAEVARFHNVLAVGFAVTRSCL